MHMVVCVQIYLIKQHCIKVIFIVLILFLLSNKISFGDLPLPYNPLAKVRGPSGANFAYYKSFWSFVWLLPVVKAFVGWY